MTGLRIICRWHLATPMPSRVLSTGGIWHIPPPQRRRPPFPEERSTHTIREKEKLLGRARWIQRQVKSLAGEDGCSKILHLIAGNRCATNGLMAEVMQGHIREHVADSHPKPGSDRARAMDEVIDLIQSYLR